MASLLLLHTQPAIATFPSFPYKQLARRKVFATYGRRGNGTNESLALLLFCRLYCVAFLVGTLRLPSYEDSIPFKYGGDPALMTMYVVI